VFRGTDQGDEVARVDAPSADEWFAQVQAAGDNRVFYAATEAKDCSSRLFKITVGEDGRVMSSEALPYGPPKGMIASSLAVSGDGARLAYGMHSCDLGTAKGRLEVAETETGRSRGWDRDKLVTNVSMSEDGRYVAFREATISVVHELAPVHDPDGIRPVPARDEPAGSGTDKAGPEAAEPAPTAATAQASEDPAQRPQEGFGEAAEPRPEEARTAARDDEYGEPGTTADVEPRPTQTALPKRITPNPTLPPIREPYSGAVTVVDDPFSSLATPSPRPTAAKGARTQFLRIPDNNKVHILDTTQGDEGGIQAITLSRPEDALLLGVTISPDGKRIYAGVGHPAKAKTNQSPQEERARSAICEFDAAQGTLVRQVAEVDSGWVYLLDRDTSGERFIVRHGEEYGVTDANGYRRLAATGAQPRAAAAW